MLHGHHSGCREGVPGEVHQEKNLEKKIITLFSVHKSKKSKKNLGGG